MSLHDGEAIFGRTASAAQSGIQRRVHFFTIMPLRTAPVRTGYLCLRRLPRQHCCLLLLENAADAGDKIRSASALPPAPLPPGFGIDVHQPPSPSDNELTTGR